MAGDSGLQQEGCTYPRGFQQSHDWPWPLVPARNLVSLQYGRALTASDRVPEGVPVYGTNGQCGWHNKPLAKGPGIILGRKGQGPLGVEWCSADFWVIDTAYYISLLRADVHLPFLFQLIKYVGLNHLKDGTSNPTLSRDSFGSQLLPLPPLPEQKRIAHILGTLDDKIKLNRRMNATLEGISRSIFKSWFVDFDPVRQKATGKQPVGMDAQTAALFPDSFQESEIGEVPKGWGAGVVGDLYDITMGQSPPGHTYNESGDGLPFFQGRADFCFRYPQRRVFCTAPTRFADPGDTLVSVRAPVGDLNMALDRCAIGRGVAAVRHKTRASGFTYYGMHALSSSFEKFEGEGTVFGSMGKKEFLGIKAVSPTEDVIHAFEHAIAPADKQIKNLERQTAGLSALRDTLLPKLLSGAIRVPEVERAVEDGAGWKELP